MVDGCNHAYQYGVGNSKSVKRVVSRDVKKEGNPRLP